MKGHVVAIVGFQGWEERRGQEKLFYDVLVVFIF